MAAFKKLNHEYNANIRTFVDQMFSEQGVGESGYVKIGEYKKHERVFSPSSESIYEELSHDEIDFSSFSEGERIVISNLLYGEKTNYVLAGAMGAGKTALLNYLKEKLESEFENSCSVFYLNFHEGIPDSAQVSEIIAIIKESLYGKLKPKLRKVILGRNLFQQIIEKIEKNEKDKCDYLISFLKFRKKPEWFTCTDDDKLDLLYEFIDDKSQLIDIKLNHLMQLARIVNVLLNKINSRLLFFFDNIDRLSARVQIKILDDIISKNEISNVRSLIALRRSTFKKFFKNGNFDYGYFHHHGPFPIRIIKSRLKYWEKNIDSHNLTKDLSLEYRNALKERIGYVKDDLKSGYSYTEKFIHSLAGRSVRVGLCFAKRVFINNIIPYNEKSLYENYIARSILIGERKTMNGKDPLIVNLFASSSNYSFSLIKIRILQLLLEFRKDPSNCKPRRIIRILDILRIKDDDEIYEAFNQLLDTQRPLIWMDTISKFSDKEQMYTSDEVVYLTEIGEAYFKGLLKDPNYLQECFINTTWGERYNTFDIEDSFYHRFDFMYKCISRILDEDEEHLNLYQEHYRVRENFTKINDLKYVSIWVGYNCAKYYLGIIRKHQINDANEFFILNWNNLLLKYFKLEYSKKLENLIDEFGVVLTKDKSK